MLVCDNNWASLPLNIYDFLFTSHNRILGYLDRNWIKIRVYNSYPFQSNWSLNLKGIIPLQSSEFTTLLQITHFSLASVKHHFWAHEFLPKSSSFGEMSICFPSVVLGKINDFCCSQGAISSHEWLKITGSCKWHQVRNKHNWIVLTNKRMLILRFSKFPKFHNI